MAKDKVVVPGFNDYLLEKVTRNPSAECTLKILGVQVERMAYVTHGNAKVPYAADMFLGGTSELGLRVASRLDDLNREKDLEIVLRDVINEGLMPKSNAKALFYEDERYLVSVHLSEGKEKEAADAKEGAEAKKLHVFIYQK